MTTLVPQCVKYSMINDMNDNIATSDSLKVNQNKDGTFTLEWDKNDPRWNFLNDLTSTEIQTMIESVVRTKLNEPLSEG